MELKEARYILAIAKHKSISKAAQSLYISQPSLSKYLSNLENELDTKLFSRINNLYVPTYAGERYLYYAKNIEALCMEWNTELDDMIHTGRGRLTISMPVMISNCIIHPTLSKFNSLYPNVILNIIEDVHFVAEHSLQDPTIDLTLYNVHEFPKNMDYDVLRKEEVVIILQKDNPLTSYAQSKEGFSHPWIDLSLFSNENFLLLYPDQNTGGIANNLFKEYDMTPHILLHTRNIELCIRLAIEGTGITFAPESYYYYIEKNYPGISTCLSVGKQTLSSNLIAAHQKGKYLPQYAKDYIEIIRKHFEQ